MKLFAPVSLAISMLAIACGGSAGGSGGTGGGGSGGTGGTGGSGCPTTTGPTTHSGPITADETWAAVDGPHHVTGNVTINGGATLTIEPCVEVMIDADTRIRVNDTTSGNGILIAEGAVGEEIHFSGLNGAAWDHLRIEYPGTASLAHVTFTDAGADTITYDGATIVAYGDSVLPLKPILGVTDVTITGSQGYGILMARMATFIAPSSGLTISGSGATLTAHEQPIRIGANALGTLPSGTYTGNATDEILINPQYDVETDMTIIDVGVPYHVEGAGAGTLAMTISRDFSNATGPIPVLTVSAGVVMKFGSGTALRIGTSAAGSNQGGINVQGTSASPAVFTSDAANPAAGDWRGIVLYDPMGATVSFDYAHIEYAGESSFCQSFACRADLDGGGLASETAALSLCDWQPSTAIMSNSTILDSNGWGVLRGWDGLTLGPDFTDPADGNTFTNVPLCAQSMRDAGGGESCPTPRLAVPSSCGLAAFDI